MVKVVSSRYTEEKCKMKKPYIICHMMTSVDGRIDCAMTSKLSGVSDYYTTLAQINVPTTVSLKWQSRESSLCQTLKFTDRKAFQKRQTVPVMK